MMKKFMMMVALVSVLAMSGCKATVKVSNLNAMGGLDIRVFLLTQEDAEDLGISNSTTAEELSEFLSNSKCVAAEKKEKFRHVCKGNYVLLALYEEVWQKYSFPGNESEIMTSGIEYSTSPFEATKKGYICFTVKTNDQTPGQTPEIENLNEVSTDPE